MPASSGAVLTARMLNGLKPFIERKGGDFDALVCAAGLDAKAISDPDAFLSFPAVVDLFERAARALGDDVFGLHFADTGPTGPAGVFYFMMLNSPTMRDALVSRTRYTSLVTTGYTVTFEKEDGLDVYTWHLPPDLGPHSQYMDFAVLMLVKRIRLMLGDSNWMPVRVSLDHREPSDVATVARTLGHRVRFDQPRSSIGLDAEALARPILGAEPILLHVLESYAKSLLSVHAKEETFTEKVTRQIALALPSGEVGRDDIAARLGIPARTLQARLARSGQSFRDLVDATRMRMAYRLLLETRTPLTEVALILGFSELSAFSRAARGWFGKSASEVRKEGKMAAADKSGARGV